MFFSKIKENFKKSKDALSIKISDLFGQNKDIDSIIDDLEELLILSDMGYNTSNKICNNLRNKVKLSKDKSEDYIKKSLKEEIINIFNKTESNDSINDNTRKIILIVGVNGVGKTTSIGKLANLYKKSSKKVLLAAADTFRAGAIEQLDIWAKRSNCDICLGKSREDPSSVIFEATKKFQDENYDVLICDTAGRLQNKKNLMDELEKMKRTIDKNAPDILKEIYIVLDATTGQNAINQVKSFYDSTQVNGIILTKLDSTAKGGVVVSIVDELNIPVKYIGVGEQIDDILYFNANDFVDEII